MKNKEILRKIYYGNRAINRNIQRLANISLIGLLARSAKEAKESDRLVFYFRTGQKPVAARIRIGVGVTTSCESAAEVLKIAVKQAMNCVQRLSKPHREMQGSRVAPSGRH